MALKAHQRALLQLLPDGLAWNKAPDTLLASQAGGLARSPSRVTERAGQLLAERFPLTATLLLADWERFLWLLDCDIGDNAGIDERQLYAANKLRMKPSLNRQFYIELARSYGFTVSLSTLPDNHWVTIVTIETDADYRPMHVLEPVTMSLWIYYARILEMPVKPL